MKHLIILCAGGFGREVYNSALESIGYGDEFDVKGFLDDNPDALDGFEGYPSIIGTIKDYQPEEGDVFVCAVGSVKTKIAICEGIIAKGGVMYTLIHRTAYISRNVVMGKGCMLLACARIHCDVTLGDYVTVQPYATVGHDVTVGKWTHINAYADCGGMSKIGEGVTLHTTCFVVPLSIVGDYATVGAGSVAMRRVKAGQTVFGVPAKPLRLPKVGGAIDVFSCEFNPAA